ncbi:malto-oligosyltrehalose trehalohydrolase [Anaeromyxobacter paludicola]|uniref:Malto-oligosyltrehalose trehalohydrolase n=1 Tax=Anaeromyxobacter paludicola TaxID=2918171 RepID=A0ABN6NAW6_9BACT|nr:malto-oligosyltrehalose trehalohydrolase [Anaeromyxobacter paludicola]BDG10392.1 malto-oligosyltrehalose trehalohydrolase [Anaeromyxobacter paludicola]
MRPPLHGTETLPGSTRFQVWAPRLDRLSIRLERREVPLARSPDGWFGAEVPGVAPGARYVLVLPDGRTRPDPASLRQPDGVHGPSQVFDPGAFRWTAGGWRGLPLEALTFYELHLGTFTSEGTLDAAAARLPELVDLGVSCVELMPVQPFPGDRNWGYDGVELHAVHEGYGGPEALQRFVDRAHGLGLAVCLDVVYNHLGPEGNYLAELGPYFTSRHRSPWGDGLNYDGEDARPVRDFMLEAAVRWARDYRVDALRLDAVQAIQDDSPRHLVGELCDRVAEVSRETGRQIHVIAESDLNDRKVVEPGPGGWGACAAWADDLHHALHALLTGERGHYYADYGRPEDVQRALLQGFVYQGQRSEFRKRPFGTSTEGLLPLRFVACLQNHDQVGNRPFGERLTALVPWEALAPAAAILILGPALPLLFMGEEYGESRPFLYFTSHGDPALARAVSEGRKKELIAVAAGRPIPDPQDPQTFEQSRLTHRRSGRHGALREVYRQLLAVRRRHAAAIGAHWPEVARDGRAFTVRRPGLTLRANLGPEPAGGMPGWGWGVEEG